jgi:xanthine dehydrogenase small subunit
MQTTIPNPQETGMRDYLLLYINGQRYEIRGDKAFMPLSDYLRYELGAVGTKVVCAEGDCGACTVLQGKLNNDQLAYQPVNSCIQYLYQLDCSHLVTIEGLKLPNIKGSAALNPVQEAMVACQGAQCGYCTPGFVVTMFDFLTHYPREKMPTACDFQEALTGNLCRCTGYESIIKAGLSVERDQMPAIESLFRPNEIITAFQDALMHSVELSGSNFDGETRLFFAPNTVEDAIALKQRYPEATVIQGGTDISVACNKRGLEPSVIVSLANWPASLNAIQEFDDRISVGAKTTLMALEAYANDKIPALSAILKTFGGPQIKYAGTLAGNIANGSPIADTLPFLMVMNAELRLQGADGIRKININQFYQGYKKLNLKPDELIIQIEIPKPLGNEHLKLYKISRRKHLDISSFTAAIRLQMQGETIEKASLAFGGVGPVVLRLSKTEAFLTGKTLTLPVFEDAAQIACSEITPISDVRGSQDYRMQLAENILLKFFYDIPHQPEAMRV